MKKLSILLISIITLMLLPMRSFAGDSVKVTIPIITNEPMTLQMTPENSNINPEVSEINTGTLNHFDINIPEPGDYWYKIKQVVGSENGKIYDEAVYNVYISVFYADDVLSYVISAGINENKDKPINIEFENIEEKDLLNPVIDKCVKEGKTWVKDKDSSQGEVLSYKLNGNVPLVYKALTSYEYTFTDKPSKGLKYLDDMKLVLKNDSTDKNEDVTSKATITNESGVIKAVFSDIKEVNPTPERGDYMEVTYSMKIEDASIKKDLVNVANLEFGGQTSVEDKAITRVSDEEGDDLKPLDDDKKDNKDKNGGSGGKSDSGSGAKTGDTIRLILFIAGGLILLTLLIVALSKNKKSNL